MKSFNPLYIMLLICDLTMGLGIRLIQIDNALEKEIEEEEMRSNNEKIQ